MALLITCNRCESTHMIQNPELGNEPKLELLCEDCGLKQPLSIVGYLGVCEEYEG